MVRCLFTFIVHIYRKTFIFPIKKINKYWNRLVKWINEIVCLCSGVFNVCKSATHNQHFTDLGFFFSRSFVPRYIHIHFSLYLLINWSFIWDGFLFGPYPGLWSANYAKNKLFSPLPSSLNMCSFITFIRSQLIRQSQLISLKWFFFILHIWYLSCELWHGSMNKNWKKPNKRCSANKTCMKTKNKKTEEK